MGETKGHSEGIWRTFAVCRTKDKDFVPTGLQDWFKENDVRWSFQRYAATKDEEAHLSFRIEFPNESLLQIFREEIKKHYTMMAETSWDEKKGTKRAYELGTKLYFLLLNECTEVLEDDRYLLQAFHGFFNDFQRDYREEALTYIYFLSELSASIKNGISLHNIELEKVETSKNVNSNRD